ncbi:MAG: hypothetical protein OIN86_07820 [Candidatus Methanoperedens sp.]|nr:hypothetical protein [Candidatus Methanoperedens sp.]CAG0976293.1 hypothetical protein METP1_01522 [Methanosarcinales archaeon]
MKRFINDESGQLILIACVSVAAALVLIATYEYSTLGIGENSINRETMNSYYFYDSIRERYNATSDLDRAVFENELKEFSLLHGYSVDFVCKDNYRNIVFIDKDIKIEEQMKGKSC